MSDRTPFVFEIPEQNLPVLIDKLDRMVKRSRKTNLPAPSLEVIWERDEEKTKREFDPELHETVDKPYWVRYIYVVVAGDRPTLHGWKFIATIDHTEQGEEGAGNIVKAVPGEGSIPVQYRTGLPVCQHCNTARRRNETFIVRNADGVSRQVGRNCLADFFEGDSPQDVAKQLEWWVEFVETAIGAQDDDFFGGMGGRGHTRFPIDGVLMLTQAVIDAIGWTSRTKARESGQAATADIVLEYMEPPVHPGITERERRGKIKSKLMSGADRYDAIVAAALEWVRGLNPTESEDYLYNLHTITRGETIRRDRLGIACSLMSAYKRHTDNEERRKEAAEKPPSEHVGTVGERTLLCGLMCKHVGTPYQGDFGPSQRILFLGDDKDVIVWYASGSECTFKQGEVYDLVMTVKKHEEKFNRFIGVTEKTTLVNRVAEASEKDYKKFKKQRTVQV